MSPARLFPLVDDRSPPLVHDTMARPLRLAVAGGVYHVVSRGNAQGPIFLDDRDRGLFFDCVDETLLTHDARCHAYCLMGNHYHLLLETRRPNLSRVMRQLNGVYGQGFNRRHHRAGHVFQGRFSATLVERDVYLLEVCRYIVLNPVRASLVTRPDQWPWSSHRAYLGLDAPRPFLSTDWILAAFGALQARAAYACFIDDGMTRPDLVEQIRRAPAFLGGVEFTRVIEARLATRPDPKT